MNSLFKIVIYRVGNTWCFDDADRGLLREPFVLGTSELIDEVIKAKGLDLDPTLEYDITFASSPFPGFFASLTRENEDSGGYWYELDSTEKKGWLCPATELYFEKHPYKIYLTVECNWQEKMRKSDDKLMYDTYSK